MTLKTIKSFKKTVIIGFSTSICCMLTAFLLLCSSASQAQKTDSVIASFNSPYQTIYNHLYYLQDDNYYPEKAAVSFFQTEKTKKAAIEASIKLKQLLDGSGIYIYLEEIPRSNHHFDSLSNQKNRFTISAKLPNIYVERINGHWFYPPSTINAIRDEHRALFKFGTHKLLEILPKMGTKKVFGLYSWQYIGMLILIFLGFLIHRTALYFINNIILRLISRLGHQQVGKTYIIPVSKPTSLFIVLILLLIFTPVLQLPVFISKYVMLIMKASIPLTAAIILYRLVDILGYYLSAIAAKTESSLDDQLVPLLRKTLKTFIVLIGTLLVLDTLAIPILPLLTGLSIGGLAFALAAQDTIKNFFGSLMIFVDKPFQIGDWITSGSIDGTVEEVGLRSTRIRTFRNSLTYVPNGILADSVVDNHGLRNYRRFYTKLGIIYGTPTHLIETFVEGLNKIVLNHPNTLKTNYHIYLNDFNASSLDIMFYIFFQVPNWGEELKCRHDIMIQIIDLSREIGVEFAFPTQTLHMENFPEKRSLSPAYNEPKNYYFDKMTDYTKRN